MLYGYPLEATRNNWLHECLSAIVLNIHAAVAAGKQVRHWTDLVPSQYRTLIKSRWGFRDRVKAYRTALETLSATEQERVKRALAQQNEIPLLLSGQANCESLQQLPKVIQRPIEQLCEYAYELLKDLDIRDAQYRIIHSSNRHHICPFCGNETYESPEGKREALDHYLLRENYPFAAANLRNLVPMGNRCNSRYKHAADMLWSTAGVRRKSYDPYVHQGTCVSLDTSKPFGGADGVTPEWECRLLPDCEEANTWDEVFQIKERFKRDLLDDRFSDWLKDFAEYARHARIPVYTQDALVERLTHWIAYQEGIGLREHAFLKAAMFRMLRVHCEQGNTRLSAMLLALFDHPKKQLRPGEVSHNTVP